MYDSSEIMQELDNVHSRLVEKLGRLIAKGKWATQGHLPREDDLVIEFAVSRTIVREATKTLQALGLVITRPRSGSRIQPISNWRLLDAQVMAWIATGKISPKMVKDLLDLRAMIEPTAAAYAAERANDAQCADIALALRDMAKAKTFADHKHADFRFHEAIIVASDNMFFMQLKPALHAVLEGSFKISMHDPQRLKASVRVHEKVYQAILNHEPEAARLSMLELLGVARADIEHFDRQSS
jgi:DNA-binding FadR family transcriptional regulator